MLYFNLDRIFKILEIVMITDENLKTMLKEAIDSIEKMSIEELEQEFKDFGIDVIKKEKNIDI